MFVFVKLDRWMNSVFELFVLFEFVMEIILLSRRGLCLIFGLIVFWLEVLFLKIEIWLMVKLLWFVFGVILIIIFLVFDCVVCLLVM